MTRAESADMLSLEELRDIPRRRRELACADHTCGGCPACLEAQGVSEDDSDA
jgi:hypothetical protein